MKRLSTFFLLLLILTVSATAGPISPEKAQEIASVFWKKIAPEKEQLRMKLAPSKARSTDRSNSANSDESYYIFTEETSNGFVIISGEDQLEPIVGYSTSNSKADEEMPEALVDWLKIYDIFVNDVRSGKAKAPARSTGKIVKPMLKTTWGQDAPYNNMCPQKNGKKTPTGCTATAITQVMKYHAWPITPKKAITWKNNITGQNENIDLTKHTYNWDDMLNSYKGSYSQKSADAVAQLMVDVGKAINSSYATEGTGASITTASKSLVHVFDYSSSIRVYNRSECTNEEWIEVLRSNLEAGRPIVYTGFSFSLDGGHAFVCDGIDENNLIHINWGWDSAYDGYFDMAYMKPDGTGTGGGSGQYSVSQSILANMYPRVDGEPTLQGYPTLYSCAPYHYSENKVLDTYEGNIDFLGAAKFRIVGYFLNWSHSSFSIDIAGCFYKDGEMVHRVEFKNSKLTIATDGTNGVIFSFNIDTKNDNNGVHLEKGKYTLQMMYKDQNGEYIPIKGSTNAISVEITDKKVIVTNEKPRAAISRVTFLPQPKYVGDKINLEARVINKNDFNTRITLIPILNTENSDGTWTQQPYTNLVKYIELADEQEMALPFDTNIKLSKKGRYFISFGYNIKNKYLADEEVINTNTMLYLEGTSDTLEITSVPQGAYLTATKFEAKGITLGSAAKIKAQITNKSTIGESYTGTVGIFAQSLLTGDEYLIHSEYIKELKSNAYKTLSASTFDYFPVMRAGDYLITTREFKDGKWQHIRQNAGTCYFRIGHNTDVRPYISTPLDINGGKVVIQGESFNAKGSISCAYGNFDGYIKVSTVDNITAIAESDYIAVNITENTPVEINIPCSSETAPLGKWRLAIKYYSKEKMLLGEVSNNTLTYSNNGYFWVGDATDISKTATSSITVTTGEGLVKVSGANENATIVVFGIDGRQIYEGTETTIELNSGYYIINVIEANSSNTFKAYVK